MPLPPGQTRLDWRPKWSVRVAATLTAIGIVGAVCTLVWVATLSNRIFPLALWEIASLALVPCVAGSVALVSFLRRGGFSPFAWGVSLILLAVPGAWNMVRILMLPLGA